MRQLFAAVTILLAYGCNSGLSGSGPWVLSDMKDQQVDLEGKSEVYVVMFISADCPLSQLYAKPFTSLMNRYPEFLFIGVSPGENDDENVLLTFQDNYGFGPYIYRDVNYNFSKKLNASVTPQFFIIDQEMNVLYNGAMDDWAIDLAKKKIAPKRHYLMDALEAISSGKELGLKKTEPVGCIIEYNDR